MKGALAVKRAVEAHGGVLSELQVYLEYGDTRADVILHEVEKWERDSKPPGMGILKIPPWPE